MARVLVLITAIGWINLLLSILPDKPIPVVSTFGKNTMPVFILHAFVIKLLEKIHFFHFDQTVNLALACILSIVIFALFGNKLVVKAFKKVF